MPSNDTLGGLKGYIGLIIFGVISAWLNDKICNGKWNLVLFFWGGGLMCVRCLHHPCQFGGPPMFSTVARAKVATRNIPFGAATCGQHGYITLAIGPKC